MSAPGQPWLVEFKVRRAAREVELGFDNGDRFVVPARLVRAMTPSAEARGHGLDRFDPVAVAKKEVGVVAAHPVGRYALRLVFDDGHDTGLYTWDRLHRIGKEQELLSKSLAALEGG
jgi:DUF971 family protein